MVIFQKLFDLNGITRDGGGFLISVHLPLSTPAAALPSEQVVFAFMLIQMAREEEISN